MAIYNATSTNNLAASAADDVKKKGYVVKVTGNFPAAGNTTIYYKDKQGKADAGLLKQDLIPEAMLKHRTSLPAQIPKEVELVIVLGSDYANTHPVPNG